MNKYKYNDNLYFIVNEPLNLDWTSNTDKRTVDFLCSIHQDTKLVMVENIKRSFPGFKLNCPLCEQNDDYQPLNFNRQKYEDLQKKALSLVDRKDLRNAKLVRLDDVYVPELKTDNMLKEDSDYFVKANIKTTVKGDTIAIIYIGYKGNKDKVQFFIKPERKEITHDFKDLDPAKILAKLELTLNDRTITQNYNNEVKKDSKNE